MRTFDKRAPFHVQDPASLGIAIRHFRTQVGVSQVELAERVGLHRSYLSALEGGRETEHMKRVFRVLKHLGVKMTLEKTD